MKDKDTLQINWVLPYLEKDFKSKSIRFFSHLFGHESENSLLSYLKEEGLAMALNADYEHEIGVFSFFSIQLTLTKKGLEKTDYVIAAVFKFA